MIRLKFLGKQWLRTCNKLYLSPLVCINPEPLSFITGNTNIDFPSSDLPRSPPIAPGLSVGTEMTVFSCEIPLNLFAIKLVLTFINSNLTVGQVEGPVEGAVDFLQHPYPTLTGSCFLQICIFYF